MVVNARQLGYDTIVVPATRLSDIGNYLKTLLALRKWAVTQSLDIAFSWMTKAHLYASPAFFGLGTRNVWYQHGVPNGHFLDRISTILPAEAVFCCSETSKAYQDKIAPKRQSYVLYPGVSVDRRGISKEMARTSLNLPQAAKVVCMVARLERWKGVHIFVQAAEQIAARFPEIVLTVIGGNHPADQEYAEELSREAQRCRNLRLLGQKEMRETALWQAAADIVVHPVTGIEPFGMAVVEAMASGKAVISTNVGGPSEIIQDGTNGVLIDRGDPQQLVKAVIRMFDEPEKRRAIEEEAYRRALAFSIPAFVRSFETLLDRVLHGARRDMLNPLAETTTLPCQRL